MRRPKKNDQPKEKRERGNSEQIKATTVCRKGADKELRGPAKERRERRREWKKREGRRAERRQTPNKTPKGREAARKGWGGK